MRPDLFNAFHQAIRLGPDYCPPDLFEGKVPAIVRGLKVHANNVAHARRVALEETYPRLQVAVGTTRFRAAADRFLEDEDRLDRSLDALGEGFANEFEAADDRDLARAEWAWLEAFHAAEAEALTLTRLTGTSPDNLVRSRISTHPAARIVSLEGDVPPAWDHPFDGGGRVLLVTRPFAEVRLRLIGEEESAIINRLRSDGPSSEMLCASPAALVELIESGALCLENDDDDV